jgi:hypothetical protein
MPLTAKGDMRGDLVTAQRDPLGDDPHAKGDLRPFLGEDPHAKGDLRPFLGEDPRANGDFRGE